MIDDALVPYIPAIARSQADSSKNVADALAELEEIVKRADAILPIIEEIQALQKLVEDEKVFEKQAINIALDEILNQLPTLVSSFMFDAAVKSGEYNYQPYLDHLAVAVGKNIYNLFQIRVDLGTNRATVTPKFEVLGDISLWESCVTAARKQLGVGKSRGKSIEKLDKKSKKEAKSTSLATIFWSKLYGSAREGATYSKKYKKERGSSETDTRDITWRYASQYEKTVLLRLSFLPDNKAPFWYIIEHGNSIIKFSDSAGKDPYPKVKPANIVKNLTNLISKELNTLIHEYIKQLKNAFKDNFEKYYKAKWERVDEIDEWVLPESKVVIPTKGGKILEGVKDLGNRLKAYSYLQPDGSVKQEIRHSGQFTPGGVRINK